ncbi:hypothetical protein VaNZ11_011511 [Volvox africanus]|uniref:Uncharacterized protein n=1 Tax=Volvox africanus TaxID=51714 RepID=A0ABQ5SD19_9CHLO|nr:hypothetical protein VaNZ11_011511 [Volvox africanus]
MSDWIPLDEKELLQEDDETKAYHSNTSRQEPVGGYGDPDAGADSDATGPRGSFGGGPRREITRDMIIRALEKQGNRRRPGAGVDDPYAEDRFLAAQSHLHLNGRSITRIANLRPLTTLEVLYLYDNQISVIENVSHLRRLTHLYLANNSIREISGLSGLSNLQKLYMEHNCLQLVSGLEACPSLEELHISSQRLPTGTPLAFDSATVTALAPSLRVLTAAHCGITSASLPQLAGLTRLRRLDLSYNAIDTFEPIDIVIQPCAVLSSFDLRGNPVGKLPKYRDTVILMNDNLTTLDDEAIPAQHREFLLRLHIRRMKAQLAAELKEDSAAGGGQPSQSPGDANTHGPPQIPIAASGPSRLPPRTGGFHPAAGGAGTGGSGRASLSRNASSGNGGVVLSSGGGSGRVSAQGIARGMEGLSFQR